MSPAFLLQIYVVLVISGLFLVGAEIFVPGGILGVMGAIALLAAIVIGFPALSPIFGPMGGLVSAVSIIVSLPMM